MVGANSSRLRRTTVALLVVVAVASWWPVVLYQAQDVDVLLYATAAAGANADFALPYTSTWIEKGPVAMGLFQLLFAVFGTYNLAAGALAWLALALCTMWLVAGLARAMGGGAWWAAAFFAVALPSVGGTLNTEVPAAAAAAALLLWCRSRGQGGADSKPSRVSGGPAGRCCLSVPSERRHPGAHPGAGRVVVCKSRHGGDGTVAPTAAAGRGVHHSAPGDPAGLCRSR
jgi:hypothetical protein